MKDVTVGKMIESELGEKIKNLRKSLNESQEEFGQRFQVEQVTVVAMGKGRTSETFFKAGNCSASRLARG